MTLFDPTSPPAHRETRLAPRPPELRGLRLGLVENTKFNSAVLLGKLGARLDRAHGMTVTHLARKRSPSHEVDEGAIEELAGKADVVISGIGD